MESHFWTRSIRAFVISACLFCVTAADSYACGWNESPETYRVAMFQAETPSMSSYHRFRYYYTYSSEPHDYTDSSDRLRNVEEWRAALCPTLRLRKNISTKDVWTLLYETPAEKFLELLEEKRLKKVFATNSFFRALRKKENVAYYEYFVYAKENEFLQTASQASSWDYSYRSVPLDEFSSHNTRWTDLITKGEEYLAQCKKPFLRKRYAFMLMRLTSGQGCIDIYDSVFVKPDSSSIINVWALMFKALSLDMLDRHTEANYLYSLVFDWSNEKKPRVFDACARDSESIDKAMTLAQNNHQRSVLLAMQIFQNPAPCLSFLQRIYTLSPHSIHLEPLITREVNKLEDWFLTPTFTPQMPAVYRFKEVNRTKDRAYLHSFLSFLQKMYEGSKGGRRDFIASAISHLYFLDDHIMEGQQWLRKISRKAAPQILRQRHIDEFLVGVYSGSAISDQTLEQMVRHIEHIEAAAEKESIYYKVLYGMLRALSFQYEKRNNTAIAGLLFNISEVYKNGYEDDSNFESEYKEEGKSWDYSLISYFDCKANEKNIDRLLKLYGKKNKSAFEEYLLSMPYPDSVALLNLKGIMAFRRNDLKMAYKAFRAIPARLWSEENMLTEELPADSHAFAFSFKKVNPLADIEDYEEMKWKGTLPAKRMLVFNKAKFIERLLKLQTIARHSPRRRGWAYLQMANAYFNTTHWGNSWRMMMYMLSNAPSTESNSSNEAGRLGSIYLWLERYMPIFFDCTRAVEYYKKAVHYSAKNPEIKAQALAMLFTCRRHQCEGVWEAIGYTTSRDSLRNKLMHSWNSYPILEQMRGLRDTKTLQDLSASCPLLEAYLEKNFAANQK